MKIIKNIKSMLVARRIQKTYRAMKVVRGCLDGLLERTCKVTFYIIPGFQEPTFFVGVATIDGEEIKPIIQVINFGVLSSSKIVEAAEMIQIISTSPKPLKFPILFAVGDTNMKSFLQDNGVNNVIVATKEDYERIRKATCYADREHVDVENVERCL